MSFEEMLDPWKVKSPRVSLFDSAVVSRGRPHTSSSSASAAIEILTAMVVVNNPRERLSPARHLGG